MKRRAFSTCLTLLRTFGIAGALAFALLFVPPAFAVEPAKDPAHSIANRFAEDAQRADAQRKEAARKQAQQRRDEAAKAKAQKAYEAEMLARARAESEERRKLEEQAARLDALRAEREARDAEAERQRAEKARLIEAAREAEKARVAEEARKVEEAHLAEVARKAAEETKRAEAERAAEERRRADIAARAVEEARKAEEIRKAEEVRKANEALRVAAEEARKAEADKRAAEARRAIERATADETRRVADIEADAEIARVAERLRRIREEDLAKRTGIAAVPANGPTIPVSGPVIGPTEERKVEPSSGRGRLVEFDERRDVPLQPPRARAGSPLPSYQSPEPKLAPESRYDGRVAVILQMEPRHRRGRGYESMDPVLCTAEGCYVSNGPIQPASFLYGRGAMRFGNAISRRAGACNHAYTCIFRNVDLGALPADVQPVDIRVIRHDRREPERVEALSKCRVTTGDRLTCTDAIEGDGYTMWVISEADAERLPPHAFDSVLAGRLADAERADADPDLMDPKLMAPRGRW